VRILRLLEIGISCLPALLFLSGTIFLSYSDLTMSKVIDMQNRVFIILFQEAENSNILMALYKSFVYVWVNGLWILFVSLILISMGFIFFAKFNFTKFVKKIDMRVVGMSQLIFILVLYLLTNSIIMLLAGASLSLGVFILKRTFEPMKKDFSTGYNVISSRLGLFNFLITVGIFLTIFLNMSTYEKEISKSNMDLFTSFVPDVSNLKDIQKQQITDIAEGFKYSLNERYKILPDDTKTQCKPMYDGLIQGLNSYNTRAIQQIDQQQLSIGQEELAQVIPMFDLLTKITPLLIAISCYTLLSVIKPFIGIFGGIFYATLKKF
jgi:hypothetical protein